MIPASKRTPTVTPSARQVRPAGETGTRQADRLTQPCPALPLQSSKQPDTFPTTKLITLGTDDSENTVFQVSFPAFSEDRNSFVTWPVKLIKRLISGASGQGTPRSTPFCLPSCNLLGPGEAPLRRPSPLLTTGGKRAAVVRASPRAARSESSGFR